MSRWPGYPVARPPHPSSFIVCHRLASSFDSCTLHIALCTLQYIHSSRVRVHEPRQEPTIRHPSHGLQLTALLALLCSTTACAIVQSLSFERPGVTLKEIHITGLGLSGGSLNLLLDVYNPNSYSLRTMRIETSVDIEETHFGDVKLEREFTVPANDHTVVEIPMTFTWSGVGAGARALLQRGSVSYVLDSKILVDTPIGDQTLDFRNRGTVPLKSILDQIDH